MKPSLFLTIYGAVVSTIALVWNIINAVSHFKGRLRVERWRSMTFSSTKLLTAGMCCRVTNIGRTSRFISMPTLEFVDFKKVTRQDIIDLDSLQYERKPEYPRELKPGETHEVECDLNATLTKSFTGLTKKSNSTSKYKTLIASPITRRSFLSEKLFLMWMAVGRWQAPA